MACGFSPNLALMLEQLAQEKEKKALEAEQLLAATTQQVARTKHKIAQAEAEADAQQQTGSVNYDWTKTYERWDAWEDPEELARKEQEARERSERAAKAQMGCNHDHSAEQKLMDMSTQEKLEQCDEFRKLGNLFFQHGQYQRAAYHYHKALVYFEYIFPESDDENAWHDDLKLKVLLNFAACRLKTNHLDDVIHHADQALAIDPVSVKALYRRAQAYRLRDDFELSLQDITKAIELSSAFETATQTQAVDPLLVQERTLLQAKMLAYKLRSKQVSSAMFKTASNANNTRTSASGSFRAGQAADLAEASVLHLDLTKSRGTGGANSSADSPEIATFDSWQPNTLGLSKLESVLAKLKVDHSS